MRRGPGHADSYGDHTDWKKKAVNLMKTKYVIACVATTAVTMLFGAGAAHASIVDIGPVQVGTTPSDQPSDLIAVSNGGNATGSAGCVPLLPPVVPEACVGNNATSEYPGLVAVSTSGSATDAYVAAVTVNSSSCADSWAVSASISGNACDGVVAVSLLGDASSDFLALSGLGSAQSGGFAVSGFGPATGSSGAFSPIIQVRDITPVELEAVFAYIADLADTGNYTAEQLLSILVGTLREISVG